MSAAERIPVIRPEKKRSRSSRKLLFFLFFFFATVLVILFFQSSISRIAKIEVKGNQVVAASAIEEASGLHIGDHFFGFRSSALMGRIKALPAVESVRIVKHFPGLVVINVQEFPRVAFQFGDNGQAQVVLANGYTTDLADNRVPVDKPVLTGWQPDDPWRGKLASALAQIPDKQLSFISEIKPAPTTSYPDKIKMYTRSQFEVYTTVTYLPSKMSILYTLIDEMKEKDVTSGVFELLEVDVHRPFELFYGPKGEAPADNKPQGKDAPKPDANTSPVKPGGKATPTATPTAKPDSKQQPKPAPSPTHAP